MSFCHLRTKQELTPWRWLPVCTHLENSSHGPYIFLMFQTVCLLILLFPNRSQTLQFSIASRCSLLTSQHCLPYRNSYQPRTSVQLLLNSQESYHIHTTSEIQKLSQPAVSLSLSPLSFSPVIFNLIRLRTPRYIFSSTLHPLSCWCVMQVIHSL